MRLSWLYPALLLTLLTACCSHHSEHIITTEHSALYTKGGTRLRLVSSHPGSLNVIFIPGGPGIDSGYLRDLATQQDIKGKSWLVDLPDNGTNLHKGADYMQWPNELVEVVKSLDNVVVVGHSYGGMLMLITPQLNQYAKAMVLLNTTPVPVFTHMDRAKEEQKKFNLPDPGQVFAKYMKKPSNYNMRLAMANFVEYYFTKFNREIGKEMLLKLEVNHLVYDWNAQHVFPNYSASYVPTIPTLIVAGEYDHITPLYNFTLDPRFKNLINTHIVTINNAGHFPWLEQPEQTKQAISTFLSGL